MGELSILGHLVRLSRKRDCSGPVGSVCTAVAEGGPATEDLGDWLQWGNQKVGKSQPH